MEMKLEARAAGAIFALSAGDDRLRKGAGVADRDDAQASGAVADRRQQHGVAKRRAG